MLVTTTDAVALDARLVLRDAPTAPSRRPPPTSRGCSRRVRRGAGSVDDAPRVRQPLARRVPDADWDEHLYALHPDADAVDGVPAFADVGDMPEPIDYLLVGVPAPRCADVIRTTAGRVPFIHVISGGFEEVGADGAASSPACSTPRAR